MTTNRCTGHCCRSFHLPLSPKELREAYDRWLASQDGYPIFKGRCGPDDGKLYNDVHLVYPMVTYLGRKQKSPTINPCDKELLGKSDPGHFYSCKHFDPDVKKCTIYEIRPRMCRGYPYSKKCNYAGCTWKKVRAKKETKKELAARKKLLKEKDKKPYGK